MALKVNWTAITFSFLSLKSTDLKKVFASLIFQLIDSTPIAYKNGSFSIQKILKLAFKIYSRKWISKFLSKLRSALYLVYTYLYGLYKHAIKKSNRKTFYILSFALATRINNSNVWDWLVLQRTMSVVSKTRLWTVQEVWGRKW